jgi:hypothetical protein
MELFNPSRRSLELRKTWLGEIRLFSKEESEKTMVMDGKVQEGETREKVVLAYVGRISHEKNIGLLISAFRGLESAVLALDPSHPGCKLILIGDGPARSSLEAECSSSSSRSPEVDISFLGYRKGEELATCYASADIFAFPSHSETFGNVVLEAMASGLPVVGLKAEGVCDLVEHGKTGYLLDMSLLPGAMVAATEKGGECGIPENTAELLDSKGPAYKAAVNQYRQLLLAVVVDAQLRGRMAKAAVEYAKTRTWSEAMGCLIGGTAFLHFAHFDYMLSDLFPDRLPRSSSYNAASSIDQINARAFADLEYREPSGCADRRATSCPATGRRRRYHLWFIDFRSSVVRKTAFEEPSSTLWKSSYQGEHASEVESHGSSI